MQWKTEPADLFITRDRLAANAAFSPRTRSENTERAYWLHNIEPNKRCHEMLFYFFFFS